MPRLPTVLRAVFYLAAAAVITFAALVVFGPARWLGAATVGLAISGTLLAASSITLNRLETRDQNGNTR